MDSKRDSKRRKDKYDEDDYHRDRRSKRPRSKSQTPLRYWDDGRRKRKNSRSRSPDKPVKQEKTGNDVEPKKDVPERKAKETDMLNTRTGGAYIPPARLRMMQAQITDKSSVAYQRLAWEALKKSIHGHINKINVGNIGIIIKELLKENIVRGRGLLCRSVIQAQAASPTFTNVYAALVAAVNSRFPNIGELLLKRLVIQFKRGFKRNDKPTCISSASFIAHLVNQRVAHEILALELLTLLVESPTDDSVEVSIAFLKECGQKLTEVSSKGVNAIFEMLRNILHEGQLDKRVQYMIEVMFQVWKDGFKDHPALIEELELVPEEDQFTHLLMLDDATDPQDILNVFKFDDKYEENEQKYKTLSKEILGSDAESGEEDGSDESGSEESDEEEAEGEQKGMTIIDNTETNLVALRRTIYLTINSSLDFEECAHKLMKMQLKPGQEVELCHMFLDCCAEQRTYEKFYGLLAQRFCNINRIYIGPFEEIFKDSYGTAHRLDTNRLRNVSKFFAHLLFTDSISWEVLECVKLNEEDTTSSSRIYIKILFQELAEYMGLKKLNDRLKDGTLQEAFSGIFPRDNPKNTRFSINFFTSIGLGGLTDELREHLKQMPKNVPAAVTEINVDSESDSDSSSSSSSSSDDSSDSSSSDSESEKEKKKTKKSKKDKNKEKVPQTPEEPEASKSKNTERWGHDGFYDTYGKDARRTESRPDRPERDRDNFAMSRDGGRRNEHNRDDRERYDRNYDRRNEDRRRPDIRNGNADEERRHRDERSDYRRDRDQHRRQTDHNNRDQNEDSSRSRRERERGERDRDGRYADNDDSRRRKGDDDYRNENRSKNDIDDRNDSRGKGAAENRNESRRKGNDDDRNESRRKVSDQDRNESQRRAEDSTKNKRDEMRKHVDDPSEKSRNKKNGRSKKDASSDDERPRIKEEKLVESKKSGRKENETESSSESSSEDEIEKKRKHKQDRKSDAERSKNKSDNKRTQENYKSKRKEKKRTDDSSEDEVVDKKRDKRNRKARESDSSDSEEEKSKEKKKNKDKKRREIEEYNFRTEKKKNREELDDEDPKERKRNKDKRQDKENSRNKRKDDEGWDIRGRDSIHKELGNRYWD